MQRIQTPEERAAREAREARAKDFVKCLQNNLGFIKEEQVPRTIIEKILAENSGSQHYVIFEEEGEMMAAIKDKDNGIQYINISQKINELEYDPKFHNYLIAYPEVQFL